MRIVCASDSSVIAILDNGVSPSAQRLVRQLFRSLSALDEPRIRNIHPAYASVLVDFDPLHMSHNEIIALLQQLARAAADEPLSDKHRITIPVCYDPRLGPDLEQVARRCGVSVAEVIQLHSSAEYSVSFLGFSPGFGYLAGLPEQLAAPRLATPRKLVAAGSVGLAGMQTGVYPIDSPGGWNLIGRTPLRMFNPDAPQPTLLKQGDTVRFAPIEFHDFESQIARQSER